MSRRHRRRNIRSSAAKVQALLGALLKALLALDFCLGYPPACPESPNFEEESSFHNALAGGRSGCWGTVRICSTITGKAYSSDSLPSLYFLSRPLCLQHSDSFFVSQVLLQERCLAHLHPIRISQKRVVKTSFRSIYMPLPSAFRRSIGILQCAGRGGTGCSPSLHPAQIKTRPLRVPP